MMKQAIQPTAILRYTNNMTRTLMPMVKSQGIDFILASPPGRVALVVLTVMVISGALSLLYGITLNLPVFLLSGIILSLLGISAAVSSRILLRQSIPALRLLSAMVALICGLLIIGGITRGVVGVNLTAWNSTNPNWVGILQGFWSAIIAWLSLRSWSKPVQRNAKRTKKHLNITAPNHKQSRSAAKIPDFKIHQFWWPFSIPKIIGKRKTSEAISLLTLWLTNHKIISRKRVKLKKPALASVSPEKVRGHRQEPITLVGIEQHNCPFCLESVLKEDSRGLKICSICKTWHHADCWQLTGECQIPHQH